MKNCNRVQRGSARAVFDLVAATGAGGGDESFSGGCAHSGKEDELADLLGECEVFLFVTEGTGHAAAAGGNDGNFMAGGEFENFNCGRQ